MPPSSARSSGTGRWWRWATANRAEVAAALADLAQLGFLRPAAQSSMAGEHEYAFWHVLGRDVAYRQLPRGSRAARHAAAATWLEAKLGERVDDIADVLADHWGTALELSRAAGQEDRARQTEPKAIDFLVRAGDRAMGLDIGAGAGPLRGGQGPDRHPVTRTAGDPRPIRRYRAARRPARRSGRRARRGDRSIRAARRLAGEGASAGHQGEDLVESTASPTTRFGRSSRKPSRCWKDMSRRPSWWMRSPSGASTSSMLLQPIEAIETFDRAMAIARELGLPTPGRRTGVPRRRPAGAGDAGGMDDFRDRSRCRSRPARDATSPSTPSTWGSGSGCTRDLQRASSPSALPSPMPPGSDSLRCQPG